MKVVIFVLLLTSISFCQKVTVGSSYQLGKNAESIGVFVSPEIITFNNRKVIFRLYGGYYLGNNWDYQINIVSHHRLEAGFESKNTMVTGEKFFNHISLGYGTQQNKIMGNNTMESLSQDGWNFSLGLGTRIITPFSFIAKYVWGPENGIRLTMEYDLF
jgi:hypothetical protein